MTEKHTICTFPFETAQISFSGDVYVCCPPWCNSYSFGNIYNQSFDEIWNGDKAKKFRQQFISGNYNICNTNLCVKDCTHDVEPKETVEKPKTFIFCYDSVCNVKCIFCRNCIQEPDLSYFDENMDKIITEMLPNANNIVLSGVGECLASFHSRKLIKRISEIYPHIKFSLITNGILCDEKNLTQLNIIDRLLSVTVSLHAVKKETYDKLVIGGNFDRVIENLHFLSKLKKEGKIERFILNFVVNAYNYQEMAEYVEMAQEIGATVGFLELLKLETNNMIYEKLNITDEHHPKYNDFVKILQNPIFRSSNCTINERMLNLKPISFFKALMDRFSNDSI